MRFIFAPVLALILCASSAYADCFQFKDDSHAEPRVVLGVTEGRVEQFSGRMRDGFVAVPRWLGNGDFLSITIASDGPVRAVVANAKTNQAIAEGWPLHSENNTHYARVHISGRVAHVRGDAGHIKIYAQSKVARDAGYTIWVTPITAIRPLPSNHCDAKFIPSQDGAQCQKCTQNQPKVSTPSPGIVRNGFCISPVDCTAPLTCNYSTYQCE